MKISTMVAGVVVLGGVALGGSMLTVINEKDVKDVHSKIEKVNNEEHKKEDIKNVKTNIPVKELDDKNKSQNEIEDKSLENKHDIKNNENTKEVNGEENHSKITKRTDNNKSSDEEHKQTIINENNKVENNKKEENDYKDESKYIDNQEEYSCSFCKEPTKYDTFQMGYDLAYKEFGNLSDEVLYDMCNECGIETCDVHKDSLRSGVEHALNELHNKESEKVKHEGECK